MKRICKNCRKVLSNRIRPWTTGYCRPCRLKIMPTGLGKKRPDMIGNKYTPVKYGKDNYFAKHKYKGKSHANWKGSKVGYHALHTWVQRKLGKPMKCEECGFTSKNSYRIHWANISGKYKRNLSDWIRLCAKCHWHRDRHKIYD